MFCSNQLHLKGQINWMWQPGWRADPSPRSQTIFLRWLTSAILIFSWHSTFCCKYHCKNCHNFKCFTQLWQNWTHFTGNLVLLLWRDGSVLENEATNMQEFWILIILDCFTQKGKPVAGIFEPSDRLTDVIRSSTVYITPSAYFLDSNIVTNNDI